MGRGFPGALLLAFATGVAAQQDATELDTVEITGSRIKQIQMEGQAPIFTLERDDIERTGLGSIGDILQELTTGGKALNAKFNSSGNFGFPADGGGIGAGSSQVDLRHLESKRVLVLVDGIRWVNESSASGIGGAVDLNTIPLSIVERIEVLEDGASAIYGSDAIAGVVNIITRRSYAGSELGAYYGLYDEGDGDTARADYTWGTSGKRFGAVITASYYNQEAISSADRELSRFPVPGTGVTRGSSGTPQGRFIFCDPRRTPDCAPEDYNDLALDDGTAEPVYNPEAPNVPPSTYHDFALTDRFNFAPFNLLLTPNERMSVFANTRFEVIDALNWYVKGLYNNRQSVNQAAPEPMFVGGDAGTGGLADTISIPASHPYNPFGIDLVAGENFSLIGRRPLEGGPRIFEQDVDTFYAATGLQGSLDWLERVFFWDANLVWSQNEAQQTFFNGYNVRRMQQALGDPGECAAIPGCVPLNIFGGQGADGRGTITQEMLDWVRVTTVDQSENGLQLLSGNVTGDLFQMTAGPLAFAAGYEYRRYEGAFNPDPVRIAGESQDSTAIPTAGDYDVNELYSEFNLPLFGDRPFAKRLDLSLALRFSSYSTFGSETTSKVGLRWQPFEELMFRGTQASGFRAPVIGELFGLTQFGAPITDPCSNSDGTANEANCRALGVPAGYEQINPQIITNTGGNPNLEPETAESLTLGVVYSPDWAEGLAWSDRVDFEVTYYDHEIDGVIRAPDAQGKLNACVQSGDPASPPCQGITRTDTGQINRFLNLLDNLARLETSGYDFKLGWATPGQPWGRLSATLQSTLVSDFAGSDDPRGPGIEVNDSAIPEWQTNLAVDWGFGAWLVGGRVRYISAVTEACSDFRDNTDLSLANLGLCSAPNAADNSLSRNELDATTYVDLQLLWNVPYLSGLKLTGGINNVLDEDPPACLTCSLNGYDAGTYDLPGQFGYVQANFTF